MAMSHEEQCELSRRLPGIAKIVDEAFEKAFGRRILFSFIVWGDGTEPQRTQYVSNAKRESVVKGLEEYLRIMKTDMPDVPEHERH